VDACGETKIRQLDVRVIVVRHEQKILGFHVAVRNPVLVAVRHRLEHLDNEIASIGFGVRLLLTDSVKEISTAHELHDDKVAVLFVKEVNEGYNVRMAQTSENGTFIIDRSIVRWWQVLAKDALNGDLSSCSSVRSTANSCK
jgi:hypothetical protein